MLETLGWTEDCWHRNYGGAPSGSAWARGGCRACTAPEQERRTEAPPRLRAGIHAGTVQPPRLPCHPYAGNPVRNEAERGTRSASGLGGLRGPAPRIRCLGCARQDIRNRTMSSGRACWEHPRLRSRCTSRRPGPDLARRGRAWRSSEKRSPFREEDGGHGGREIARGCEMHFTANRLTTGVGMARRSGATEVQSRPGEQGGGGGVAARVREVRGLGARGVGARGRGRCTGLRGEAEPPCSGGPGGCGTGERSRAPGEAGSGGTGECERGTRGADSTPTTTSAANCDGWNTKAFFEQATP